MFLTRSIFLVILVVFPVSKSLGAMPRVTDYRLNVIFQPEKSFMTGIAIIDLDTGSPAMDSIHFYLHGELNVDSLFANSLKTEFNQQSVYYEFDYSLIASRVAFSPNPKNITKITVYYSGHFNRSVARSPSDYMRIDSDGVFLRAYGYSLWFPVFLESNTDAYSADFSEVIINVPVDFVPVFAGDRVSEDINGGRRISRWHATQLDLIAAQCTAQKFRINSEGSLFLYCYDDSASLAMAHKILTFVRDLNAEYRDKYRHESSTGQIHVMEMPEYADISSANVTGITSEIWQQFDSLSWSKRGLAHEIVHPFVQTDVKRNDLLFALEIEGFPSYFHLPILIRFLGEDWYTQYMKETETEYLRKRKTGSGWRDRPVPIEIPLTRISADQIGEYKDVFVLDDRALLFLNWLYRRMRRDRFFDFTRDLFNSGTITFDTFRRAILKYLPAAGSDLDTWLNTTDYPQTFYLKGK